MWEPEHMTVFLLEKNSNNNQIHYQKGCRRVATVKDSLINTYTWSSLFKSQKLEEKTQICDVIVLWSLGNKKFTDGETFGTLSVKRINT